MPDGNSAALNEYEARQAHADRTWAALEPRAREDVQYHWWRRLTMDDVIDALANLNEADSGELLKACRRGQSADAGALLTTALYRAADYYLETKSGQEAIAERVWQIDNEERDL